jgi:PPOX class probable F420-dependent enzyme
VLVGKERFSEKHAWSEMAQHWPASLVGRAMIEVVDSAPLAHLTTINTDGSPQVSVIWIGLDGDEPVSGHMRHHLKLRNIERDPRVVLSFAAPREPGVFLNPYGVLHARATVEPSDHTWDLLNRLTRTYVARTSSTPLREDPATSCGTRSSGSEESARGRGKATAVGKDRTTWASLLIQAV